MVPERMSAAVFHRYGGPEVLQWVHDVPVPAPREGEVLLRVKAASVNPGDAGVRRGDLKWMTGRKFPQVPGMDMSGVVVKGAGPFQPGDEVFGMGLLAARTCAQFAVLPWKNLARKPEGLSHTAAAALPVAGLTAWQALREHGGVREGTRVLVRGASGGVGSFAVQLARHLGAHVTTLCSRENGAFVRELGAHTVLDYRAQPLDSLGERFDLVLDVHGRLPLGLMRRLVAKGGRYVSIVPTWGQMALAPLSGLLPVPRMKLFFVAPRSEELAELGALAARGELKVPVTEVLPMSQVAEAHTRIGSGHTRGKLVLVPQAPASAAAA